MSNLKYYKFKNHEVLYGEAPDEYIMSPINYSLNIELNEGAKYILFLKRYDVIYNPFPIYEIEDAFYFNTSETCLVSISENTVQFIEFQYD